MKYSIESSAARERSLDAKWSMEKPANTVAFGGCQALVLSGLETDRRPVKNIHRRRHFRFLVPFRRQPGSETSVLPAERDLRPRL